MFFGIGNKWKNWKPTDEYLTKVIDINTISKLQNLMKNFVYKWDKLRILAWKIIWDNWQMPDESLSKMEGDCEDAAILTLDILGRILKKEDAKFLMYFGHYMTNNKPNLMGHCVTAYKDVKGKYNIFTNNITEYGYDDFLAIGHRFYPLGLKYQEIRGWRGNIISRKFKICGTF